MSIIVVGNGPSALNHKYDSKHINSFDSVMRFNNFITDGYEHKIGHKTTVWALAGLLNIPKHLDVIKQYKCKYFLSAVIANAEQLRLDITNLYRINSIAISYELGNEFEAHFTSQDMIKYAHSFAYFGSYHPSTGLWGIIWSLLRHKTVYIIGFDNFIASDNTVDYSYYCMNRRKAYDFNGEPHNGFIERDFIQKHVEMGKIIIL